MKKFALLVVCGLLAGCDYTVPLVTTPTLPMDGRVIGLWQQVKTDGGVDSLLVLPLNKAESLISFPAGAKDAMFGRACLCRVGTKTLVQLQWFGTAQGKGVEDDRVFQFADYAVSCDTMKIRLLNSDVVKRDVKSYDELATAIAENTGKTNLFREDMVFKKASK